jgi:hypothetical protein
MGFHLGVLGGRGPKCQDTDVHCPMPPPGSEPGRLLHVRGHLQGTPGHLPGCGQSPHWRCSARKAMITLVPCHRLPLPAVCGTPVSALIPLECSLSSSPGTSESPSLWSVPLFPGGCPTPPPNPALPYRLSQAPSPVGNEPLIAASGGADCSCLVSVTPSSQPCHGHLVIINPSQLQTLAGVMDLMSTAPAFFPGTLESGPSHLPTPGTWYQVASLGYTHLPRQTGSLLGKSPPQWKGWFGPLPVPHPPHVLSKGGPPRGGCGKQNFYA